MRSYKMCSSADVLGAGGEAVVLDPRELTIATITPLSARIAVVMTPPTTTMS